MLNLKIFFTPTVKKRMIFFLFSDIILISLAIFLAFLLRFDGKIPNYYFPTIFGLIVLSLIILLPVFYFFGIYFFSWSYISSLELTSIIKAITIGFLILTLLIFLFRDISIFYIFPRSILFIGYFLTLFLCGGFRFAKRFYLEIFPKKSKRGKERTLIVGAGDAGEQILRNILASKDETLWQPIGFIDDSPLKQGMIIHGLRVLGKIDEIPRIVKAKEIEAMIIALPGAGPIAIKKAVQKGREAKLKEIKIVPPITEIIEGGISLKDLKEPEIEELLAREPVLPDLATIKKFISGKSVLITGAAGSIGSELSRQTLKFSPTNLILLDQEETGLFNLSEELKEIFPKADFYFIVADIQDRKKIEKVFNKFQPDIVFHAAAYKHVPVMEENPDEAVKNNVFGTKIVAEASLKSGVKNFIYISTDKAINPTSVMGATKRVGEMICQSLNKKGKTQFISVRFGNVLDSRGNVIEIFKKQIEKGGPLKITHPEMKRYFMTCPEACLLVMLAGAIGKGGEVLVLDMGKPRSILELAKEMILLYGLKPDKDIPIVFTQKRPGEKLFEEIFTPKEKRISTPHPKIFVSQLSDFDEKGLNLSLIKLKKALETFDGEKIKKTLKELIPSYKPFS